MSIPSLLSNFDKNLSSKKAQIKKLENEISSLRDSIALDLSLFLKENQEEIIDFELISKHLPPKLILKIILEIAGSRTLKKEEITFSVLRAFEFIDREDDVLLSKINNILKDSFDNLDDKEKLKISLFCSGISSLHSKYKFLKDYVFEKYHFYSEYQNTNSNCIKFSGFNHKLNQASLKLVTFKNNTDNFHLIAKSIISAYENGYLGTISIFEKSLGKNGCYYQIKVLDDNNEISKPTICDGNFLEYESKGDTFEEQILDVLKKVSSKYYYKKLG